MFQSTYAELVSRINNRAACTRLLLACGRNLGEAGAAVLTCPKVQLGGNRPDRHTHQSSSRD